MRIAVLLTTYNRKKKTLTCLRSLSRQELRDDVKLDVWITDDNSSDGTAEAVKFYFPDVTVLPGTGSLFWAGGMRNSWSNAIKEDYDYYLLLNDDTVLAENAIETLLLSQSGDGEAICIGSTCNEEGKITYGGKKLYSRRSLKSSFVHSMTDYLPCDLGNANIMLVPRSVTQKIGILSDAFTHGIADYDYTLKAKKLGIPVVVAPGFLGTCIHDNSKNWKSSNVNLKDRISFLKSPKGLAYKEYLLFISAHFPLYYPAAFAKLWLKTLFPGLWDLFKK